MDMDESKTIDEIISFLIGNKSIYFKNQSREETDLTDNEKFEIAKEIYHKSKSNFLTRFGKYLKQEHLDFFKNPSGQILHPEEIEEIQMILTNLSRHSESDRKLKTKNRRYEALNKLIKENAYFSENEMMKRNPLLYDQLVGQYLSANEKKERDMHIEKDTLVKILMEGIERDITEDILKKQLEEEEENDSKPEDEAKQVKQGMDLEDIEDDIDDSHLRSFKWGEFHNEPSSSSIIKPKKSIKIRNPITKKKTLLQKDSSFITAEERRLLKEEFTTVMYQNFLNGKDDFDYATVDNNDEYDNIDILDHDEEDKYFDSEEPDDGRMEEEESKQSSEDELDIYMNALNQHPSVVQLSDDLEKM